MEYFEILFYIELIGRNAIALAMMIILFKRYNKMQVMGKANTEVRNVTPTSYIFRFLLLLSNSVMMLLTIGLYYFSNILEQEIFNFYQFSWTLIFLIMVNILQQAVMRKEYRRQVQYTKFHQIYWLADFLLFSLLFFAELTQLIIKNLAQLNIQQNLPLSIKLSKISKKYRQIIHLFFIQKTQQDMISLPVVRITIKVFILGFSYYKNTSSMKVLEKSFLSQANKYLADLPSSTRNAQKASNLNTQADTARSLVTYSKKNSLQNNYRDSNDYKRISIIVKYQFHLNNKGEVFYVLECQNYLKIGSKVIIKKNMLDLLQLQKDINSIKNPLNLTNFSYISSQIANGSTFNSDNPVLTPRNNQDNNPSCIFKDANTYEGSIQNIEELKIEENRFKQIQAIQKYLDYVSKEFYFEEVFLVKFLGLTRKQYYEEVSMLQGEDCGYQNEDEFIQFKEDYPQLKHSFQICPLTKVQLETLGNIKNDNVTYYQITLKKKQVNSCQSLPSQSAPLRYTDFSNFYKQFQKEIFPIRLPDFPPKSILNDKETMYQRKQMLLKFLTIVYNENIYFSETLFDFQNCFKDFIVQKAQNIKNDLFQYFVTLQGKYLNSSKQFLFKFQPKSQQKRTFFIVKRFKDIINLHKDLELYYSNLLQYLVQQAYESFKQKQIQFGGDPQFNPCIQEEKNILKEIKKTIKIPRKPKNINDCASYLQEVLDCNLYHKSVSFRQFLFGFEYLEELLNENANSSKCHSKRQSFVDDINL